MISEAILRGEVVYNIALRIDPNSLMHAAAFQLIRNVLHGCGTVIALRPEDNSAAATVEIVEAALASMQPEERIAQRCRIPAIVSDLRIERAAKSRHVRARIAGGTFLRPKPPALPPRRWKTVAIRRGFRRPHPGFPPRLRSPKAPFVWTLRASMP